MNKINKKIFLDKITLSNWQLIFLTGVVFALYVTYSFVSDGYYQHDEAAHYLNMRSFWHNPSIIMGNWAKPGYKLIFVPFALLGPFGLILANSLVASLSCYLTYKLAEAINLKIPLFAFLLLAFQPFWLQLSFRNYSELITAFFLIASVYSHIKDKRWITALLLSYAVTIRQELYPLLAIYGLYLLMSKEWKVFWLIFVFPVIHNGAGWVLYGDPLYLLNSVINTSSNIGQNYPRQGFSHYFRMAPIVYGGFTTSLFLVYLTQRFIDKEKWHWFIICPAAYYFLIQVLFSMKSLEIGPSNAGNLRYLIIVSPLFAILGAVAFERLLAKKNIKDRVPEIITLIVFAFITLLYLSFEHNNLFYNDQKSYLFFLSFLPVLVLAYIRLDHKKMMYSVILSIIFSAIIFVRPIERSDEDTLVANFAKDAERRGIHKYPILMDHTMMYYFWGKPKEDFENGADQITVKSVENAQTGTIIIWDSHYSYRGSRKNQLNYTYFIENQDQFEQIITPRLTKNQRFGIFTFRKL